MRIAFLPPFRITAGLLLVVLLGVVGCQVLRWRNPASPDAILARADEMSWLNNWIAAEPLYRQAELQFTQRHQLSKALYARVSEMPARSESSSTVPAQIALLTYELALPEAQEPETRLRVLTILGMLEVNYDAGMARKTWADVQALAIRQHHYLLASRAMGEQGIAAFLLGDIATAKKNVVKAWFIAKIDDPGAHIRYASMYGTGLVEMHKCKEALGPLDEAIKVAAKTHGAAYPTIAITAKVEALSGLGENKEALALASEEMQRVSVYHLAGHLYELYQTRAGVYERMGQWDQAVSDYGQAVQYAKQLSYWRGLTQVDGSLATAYLHQGALQPALTAINEAIASNEQIPDELYFVPRDLAIKAEIMARLGDNKSAIILYEKSADMLDALLSRVPTPTVERQLLADLSKVYSGYFEFLCDQGKTAEAFRVIERARGRVEAQSLAHHEVVTPHELNPVEQRLTKLNIDLLNADDSVARAHILDSIYETELQLDTDSTARNKAPEPVDLRQLQHELRPSELFVEYVLDNPHSYALALTHNTVHRYTLASKDELEQAATQYRSEIRKQKTDLPLAQQLFNGLLGSIPEFKEKTVLIVVPDGKLHLLPIAALADSGQYILAYLKVAMFPGLIGVEVANEISRAVEGLGKFDSLIIDLRGNTGGGIGALRVMSLLTPGRIPVGFALDRKRVTPNLDVEKQRFRRFHAIPASKNALWLLALKFAPAMLANRPIVLETEGLGSRDFHGRVTILVNRHTASAAEMIVAFARENNLARIIGEKTAGKLLSATSVKVGHGFRLALPTGAYYTWKGSVLEGTPIEPDELVEFAWRAALANKDCQLQFAIESVSDQQRERAS